jgi:hypothetical protein
VAWGFDTEWTISSFGEPWRIWLVPDFEPHEQGPSRADLVGGDNPLGALLYSAFDDSGAVSDEVAVPLLRIYDALTGRGILQELKDPSCPTDDPRGLLRGFERELADAIYDAVELGRLRFERVAAPPWPFLDKEWVVDVPAPPPIVAEETTFIRVKIIDQDGRPVGARRVRIEGGRDTEKHLMTDASGRLYVGNLAKGTCKVIVLDVDHRDVQNPRASPANSEKVDGGERKVRQGDTMASIAMAAGFLWNDTVWSTPENKDLRDRRADPNVLLPGDVLHVPDRIPPLFSLPTGADHTIVLRLSKLHLRVKLRDWFGEPRATEDVTVVVDGAEQTTTSDEHGLVTVDIPAAARSAAIRGVFGDEIRVAIGHLDPGATTSGAAARLRNLGYYPTSTDPQVEDHARLRFAVESFVDASGARTTHGRFDNFIDDLQTEHGA